MLQAAGEAMRWMFTEEELKQLDGHPAEDPDEAKGFLERLLGSAVISGPAPARQPSGGGAGAGEARPPEPGAHEGARPDLPSLRLPQIHFVLLSSLDGPTLHFFALLLLRVRCKYIWQHHDQCNCICQHIFILW